MNFYYTPEQQLLRDTVRRFMTNRYKLDQEKLFREPKFDKARWNGLAQIGCHAVGFPEELGGIGDIVEIALLSEEFGRGVLTEPYVGSTVFAGQVILRAGTGEQRAALIEPLIAGDAIYVVAYSELGSGGDPAGCETLARQEGDGYILNGRKTLVRSAHCADQLIVSARLPGQQEGILALFLVKPGADGITIENGPLSDGTWAAEISLNSVRVNADAQLGTPSTDAASALREAWQLAILGTCAESVGAIERALELSVEYLKTRKQFGEPLAKFQALRHRVADMAIARELCRGALNSLIAALQDPTRKGLAKIVARTKALVGEKSRLVCSQAVQLHGGMGMTLECGVGRFLARASVLDTMYGQGALHRGDYGAILAREILESRAV